MICYHDMSLGFFGVLDLFCDSNASGIQIV